MLPILGYLKGVSRAIFHEDSENRIHLGLLAVAFAVERPVVDPGISRLFCGGNSFGLTTGRAGFWVFATCLEMHAPLL